MKALLVSSPPLSCLEEKTGIPMVAAELPLLLEIQADHWWQDVTPLILESVRKRRRLLVTLIDKQKRKPIYSDFEDQIGEETAVGSSEVRCARYVRTLPRQGALS